jgi:hypothetical protein
MKTWRVVGVLAFAAAFGTVACNSSPADLGNGNGEPISCGAAEHSCECATGSYCLAIGAACISPTSDCPVSTDAGHPTAPDASDSSACVTVTIAPSDLTCTSDADCTAVVKGELCTAPCCPEDAVNTSAAARFATLTAGLPPPVGGCGPCGEAQVACVAGACVDR